MRFNQILKHTHREKETDREDNFGIAIETHGSLHYSSADKLFTALVLAIVETLSFSFENRKLKKRTETVEEVGRIDNRIESLGGKRREKSKHGNVFLIIRGAVSR